MCVALPRVWQEVQEGAAAPSSVGQVQCALWVDKYSPRRFTDLLSSETINRNVCRRLSPFACWVRGWAGAAWWVWVGVGDGEGGGKGKGKGGGGGESCRVPYVSPDHVSFPSPSSHGSLQVASWIMGWKAQLEGTTTSQVCWVAGACPSFFALSCTCAYQCVPPPRACMRGGV